MGTGRYKVAILGFFHSLGNCKLEKFWADGSYVPQPILSKGPSSILVALSVLDGPCKSSVTSGLLCTAGLPKCSHLEGAGKFCT